MNYICKMPSPVGCLTVVSDGTSITGLWIEGQKYFAAQLGDDTQDKELPVFEQVKKWLNCYFTGKEPDFMPPLAPKGSLFRQEVWKILSGIPYGQVITYGQIAKELDKKVFESTPASESSLAFGHMSPQAVGGAVGHNPISILIPCHRVVGASGSLTGYAGGISIKVKLLELEKVSMEGLYIPKKGTAL